MSADKRSTHTDALATLGTIITDGGRDAIHLAVEPVIAGEDLKPGDDIGLSDGKAYNNSKGDIVKFVGIVDPFLKEPVKPGEMFWLIVYPRQITSLRHVWEHPDFPSETELSEENSVLVRRVTAKLNGSDQWLRDFASDKGVDYDEMMRVALNHANGGYDYITLGESDTEIPNEFWDHYERVTGKEVAGENRGSFFSCSC